MPSSLLPTSLQATSGTVICYCLLVFVCSIAPTLISIVNSDGVYYNMHSTVSILCVIAPAALISALEIRHECKRDSDCTADNSYCSPFGCERCYPCEIANRLPSPSAPECAREEEDCGSCLPGFIAEDYTDQRHSYKCFSIADVAELSSDSSRSPWTSVIAVSAVVFLLAVLIALYLKHRPKKVTERSEVSNEDSIGLMSTAPSFCEQLDSGLGNVRVSDTRTVVHLERDHLVQATPIGLFHRFREVVDEDDSTDAGDFIAVDVPVAMNERSSTETIPSTWEHDSSLHNLQEEMTTSSPSLSSPVDQSAPSPRHSLLIRSQSLELPLVIRSHLVLDCGPNSQSDPVLSCAGRRRSSLGGETYRYLHVRLSNQRIASRQSVESSSATESQSNGEEEPGSSQSLLECNPVLRNLNTGDGFFCSGILQPFTSRHLTPSQDLSSSSPQASQDSGFSDRNRRRSRPFDDEADQYVGLSVSVTVTKHRRKDSS